MEKIDIENYFFDTEKNNRGKKYLVVIIYDVVDNKRRTDLSKYLQSYGFRVQRSAFEAIIDKKLYNKLVKGIPDYISQEDNVKVYKLSGYGEVVAWGDYKEAQQEEVIII